MALFDIALLGKELVRSKSKRGKAEAAEGADSVEGAASAVSLAKHEEQGEIGASSGLSASSALCAPDGADDAAHASNAEGEGNVPLRQSPGDLEVLSTASSKESELSAAARVASTVSGLDLSAGVNDATVIEEDAAGMFSDLTDVGIVETDAETLSSSSSSSDEEPEAGASASASQQQKRTRSFRQRLFGGRSKKQSAMSHGSSSAMRKASQASMSSTTEPVERRYEEISVELSNSMSVTAHKRGFGPAFRLLKSMNRVDREKIMELLLIKRKGPTFNDEVDAFDILFRSIFGIRPRTNSALRTVGVMDQSSWVHSLLKSATALKISRKMVFSSGDWRIPTRLTSGISNKHARKAGQEETLFADDNLVLDKAEHRFYRNFQHMVELRLGAATAKKLRAFVLNNAGDRAPLFDGLRPDQLKIKPTKAEKKKTTTKKNTMQGDQRNEATAVDGDGVSIGEVDSDGNTFTDEDGKPAMRAQETALSLGESNGEAVEDLEGSTGPSFLELHIESAKEGDEQQQDDDDAIVEQVQSSFNVVQTVANIERTKPGFGKYALLLVEVCVLRSKAKQSFQYTDKTDMIKKMGIVGAKDGFIGLSLGIPLATFVNPFLGFPLMGMSFINLSMGSTEFNIIEPICMIMLHQLFLAANGTSVRDI